MTLQVTKLRDPVAGLAFTGYGHAFPSELRRPEDEPAWSANDAEAAVVGSSVPRARHVCREDESIEGLACEAARAALHKSGRSADEVELLILSNWTDPTPLPSRAPGVAHLLGADDALALDINAACIGFVLGVQLAADRMRSTGAEVAVVVAADRFSRRVRPGSRGESVCGDGAGAVVMERQSDGGVLLGASIRSDGSLAGVVTVRGEGQWITSRQDVAQVASESMVARAVEVLGQSGLQLSDVSWCVPHSGTAQVLESLHQRLGLPPDRVLTNYGHRANTGSATVPSSVSEYLADGTIRRGDVVLAPSVGSGWYSGALLFRV